MTHDQARHEGPGDWWNAYRKVFPAAVIALFEAEAHATSARVFSASAFPTPVQEPDYAEAVLRSYGDSFTADKIQHAIAAREMRRAAYLDGGLEASFIVDASVLRRPAGSDTIMTKQRARAQELHLAGRAPINVMDGFYFGMETSFSLFTVAGDVLAFEDTEKELVQVDATRRDELAARFDDYARRATPLVDHPLLRLPE
ncbi:Scr1 family TA system antitoxin-like transcriptional regulator [Streptomyces sp. MN03-5084-2B]|nr:Scr1 family TA system antitoxin-like transcriptional regulator [Streptomyces sp. MN03-5084-2B]